MPALPGIASIGIDTWYQPLPSQVEKADAPRSMVVAPPPLVSNSTWIWLAAIDARIDERVYSALSIEASVASRASYGGTAPDQVRQRVAEARERLAGEAGASE